MFIFLVLFLPFLPIQSENSNTIISSQENQSFQLIRVTLPEGSSIEQEIKKADARVFRKYVITSTAIIGTLALLWACHMVRDAALKNDAARASMQYIPKTVDAAQLPPVLQPQNTINQGWASWFLQNSKNFGLGLGKMFADSGLLLVSGLILNGAYSYASGKITQAYADETVLWYAYEQTKIPELFNDLKLYATDYDLYASLLSAELFNQDAKIQMKAFVKDLVSSAQNYLGNEVFQDPGYFEMLLQDMKKKYMQKGKELEKLEEFIVPAAAKQHRAVIANHTELLFAKDMNRRSDIATMCQMFAEEMQKLLAFIEMRGGLRQKARISDMVDACNKFLDHMEILLNSTPEQLQMMSKNDCGMFTSVYEYEKLFSEQVNFLHRYCRLNS